MRGRQEGSVTWGGGREKGKPQYPRSVSRKSIATKIEFLTEIVFTTNYCDA